MPSTNSAMTKLMGIKFTSPTATSATIQRTPATMTGQGGSSIWITCLIHGQERSDMPFPVKYHGDELPAEGIDPRKFSEWDLD